MKFEGIYTPIITPFSNDGEIDWNVYAEVIDWQIENVQLNIGTQGQ
jgi:4-hydroxy-tetrahydrodipicolinate synthase